MENQYRIPRKPVPPSKDNTDKFLHPRPSPPPPPPIRAPPMAQTPPKPKIHTPISPASSTPFQTAFAGTRVGAGSSRILTHAENIADFLSAGRQRPPSPTRPSAAAQSPPRHHRRDEQQRRPSVQKSSGRNDLKISTTGTAGPSAPSPVWPPRTSDKEAIAGLKQHEVLTPKSPTMKQRIRNKWGTLSSPRRNSGHWRNKSSLDMLPSQFTRCLEKNKEPVLHRRGAKHAPAPATTPYNANTGNAGTGSASSLKLNKELPKIPSPTPTPPRPARPDTGDSPIIGPRRQTPTPAEIRETERRAATPGYRHKAFSWESEQEHRQGLFSPPPSASQPKHTPKRPSKDNSLRSSSKDNNLRGSSKDHGRLLTPPIPAKSPHRNKSPGHTTSRSKSKSPSPMLQLSHLGTYFDTGSAILTSNTQKALNNLGKTPKIQMHNPFETWFEDDSESDESFFCVGDMASSPSPNSAAQPRQAKRNSRKDKSVKKKSEKKASETERAIHIDSARSSSSIDQDEDVEMVTTPLSPRPLKPLRSALQGLEIQEGGGAVWMREREASWMREMPLEAYLAQEGAFKKSAGKRESATTVEAMEGVERGRSLRGVVRGEWEAHMGDLDHDF